MNKITCIAQLPEIVKNAMNGNGELEEESIEF